MRSKAITIEVGVDETEGADCLVRKRMVRRSEIARVLPRPTPPRG